MNHYIINEIINDDGTPYDPPELPEYTALKEKYPMCKSWGYKCIYCNKCPMGSTFNPELPEEKDIMHRQAQLFSQYVYDHNPSIKELHGKK